MNEMIKKQLEHRTIRKFKDEKISTEIFETLINVAQRTPTANGMQQASIIRITDPKIKQSISEVCKQEYVALVPELLIFIVDLYRNNQIAIEKGLTSENANDMDKFFAAYIDGCITAQNVVNAAEALDLGVVYLGSILNDSEKICEILKLPKLTFPIVGLGIGYPDQSPQLKPRMAMDFRVFENSYEIKENYLHLIKDYDKELQTYYDLRDANRRVDSFSDQVVSRMNMPMIKRQQMLEVIKKQGFDLKDK